MEFLRKTLVVVFGILSLFFAVVAVLKHVAKSDDKGSEIGAYVLDWNSNFLNTAEKAGRPVFLLMAPDTRILKNPEATICTRFRPSSEAVSSVKKWIAHSEGFAKGELHLNEEAVKAVKGKQAVSILSVGVTHIEGDFEKDDIVKIVDAHGKQIGVGRVSVDSSEARLMIGVHGQKPLVHYDYLYLD